MKLRFVMPLAVLLSLSILAACDGAEGRKQKYLERAEESFQSGDYEKARINFKNVLQIDPKDMRGREGFAKTLEKLQDWRGAVGQYRAIVEEDPSNLNAKVKLGQLYLLAKASDLAMTMADEVLAVDGTHDGGLAVKAGAQMQMGHIDEAVVNAEQAYRLNENSVDNIVLLSSLYGTKGRPDDAIALLEKEQKIHPNSSSIQTLLAQFYLSTDRIALAEQALRKLIELNPQTIGFKSQLARFYESTGRKGEAEAVLMQAVKQSPEDVEAITALHVFYMQRQDVAKAESVLQDAIVANPDNNDLRLRLGGFYLSQKKVDEARQLYTALVDKDMSTMLKAKTRLAYMATQENKADEAMKLIDEVLLENPSDVEALTLRGGIYLAQDKPVEAINDLRAVLGATPDSPDVIKMLGRAHRMNGEKQQATDLFKTALDLQPKDLELRLQLSDLYLEQGEINQAARQLEVADKVLPDNPRILEKMVVVYLQGQYLDDADKVIQRLEIINTESPRSPYYAGLVSQARNKHEDALARFDEALVRKPGAIEPMTAKVKSYIALDQIDEAIVWLQAAMENSKENPVAHNLLGELWLAKKEWAKARAAFEQCIAINKDWWIPYRNIALVLRSEEGEKEAYAYLQEAAASVDSMPLRIEAANYAQSVGDYNGAIEQYEAVLARNPENKTIINNLAMLIVTHQNDASGLKRAAELSRQLEDQDNPFFLDTAGWVYFHQGDYQRALPIIRQAAQGAPEDPAIQYHLALVYWESKDSQNAARHLENALGSDKPFSGREQAEKLLAQIRRQS